MRIKVYYNANLSQGKSASQAAHACMGLLAKYNVTYNTEDVCIALQLSTTKLKEKIDELANNDYDYYIQKDKGLTEVEPNTETAIAYVEIW